MTRLVLTAVGALVLINSGMSQERSAERARAAVQGSCQVTVKVQSGLSNTATCDLQMGDRTVEVVSRSRQLVVESLSANCVGLPVSEIGYLALYTKLTAGAEAQPSYIPLVQRRIREGVVQTRYLASLPVVLYAGPETPVTTKLSLESDIAPPLGAATTCDVRFQGHLRVIGGDQ